MSVAKERDGWTAGLVDTQSPLVGNKILALAYQFN